MDDFKRISLGEHITTLTDYHANGSYEILRKNVQLKAVPDYAVMIRTLNFERPDFKHDLIYLNEIEYNYLEKTKVYPNDILMNKIANPGSVYLMPDLDKPVSLAMNLFLIRFDDNVNQVFMFYLMKTNERYIKKFANGTTTLTITKDAVRGLCFNVPSKPHQDKIAKTLTNLDQKIALNNQINTELEAMAKLIYDYWFVQFDFPDANGKPYKSSGGKMVYNEALKREIPEGWSVEELNQCVDTILDHRGKTPKKLGGDWTDNDDGIIALSAKLVKGGKLRNLEKANKVDRALFNKWMPEKLKDGDILMTSEAPAGEFYFIHGKTDYCMSQRLFGIRGKQELLAPTYLYYELSKGHGYSQILGSLSGSTVFGIRQDVLRTIKVVVPELALQKRFDEIVLPQLKQIKNLDQANIELSALRDWLLPMLMNGQVTVKDTAS